MEVETLAGREELPTPLEAIKTTQQNGIAVGPKTFPLEDMLFLRLDPRSPAPRPAEFTLVLRDGGEISGSVSEGDENKVVWRSSTISPETLSIRLEDIRGLLVLLAGSAAGGSEALGGREAPTKAARSEWIRLRKEISSANEKRDQIALLEGGKVQGILEAIEASGVQLRAARERPGRV